MASPPRFLLADWNGTIELQCRWAKVLPQDGPLTVQAEFQVNASCGGAITQDLVKQVEESVIGYFMTHKIQWNAKEDSDARR